MDFDSLFAAEALEKAVEAALESSDSLEATEAAFDTLQHASLIKPLIKPIIEPFLDQFIG